MQVTLNEQELQDAIRLYLAFNGYAQHTTLANIDVTIRSSRVQGSNYAAEIKIPEVPNALLEQRRTSLGIGLAEPAAKKPRKSTPAPTPAPTLDDDGGMALEPAQASKAFSLNATPLTDTQPEVATVVLNEADIPSVSTTTKSPEDAPKDAPKKRTLADRLQNAKAHIDKVAKETAAQRVAFSATPKLGTGEHQQSQTDEPKRDGSAVSAPNDDEPATDPQNVANKDVGSAVKNSGKFTSRLAQEVKDLHNLPALLEAGLDEAWQLELWKNDDFDNRLMCRKEQIRFAHEKNLLDQAKDQVSDAELQDALR